MSVSRRTIQSGWLHVTVPDMWTRLSCHSQQKQGFQAKNTNDVCKTSADPNTARLQRKAGNWKVKRCKVSTTWNTWRMPTFILVTGSEHVDLSKHVMSQPGYSFRDGAPFVPMKDKNSQFRMYTETRTWQSVLTGPAGEFDFEHTESDQHVCHLQDSCSSRSCARQRLPTLSTEVCVCVSACVCVLGVKRQFVTWSIKNFWFIDNRSVVIILAVPTCSDCTRLN